MIYRLFSPMIFVCRCLFTVGILSGLLTKELQALQKAQAWFSPFLEILVAAFHFQKYSIP